MFKIVRLFFMASMLVFIAACEDDDESSKEFIGYQYLPLELGQENTYQVDSIKYDDFTNTIDTIQFQRREVVDGTFVDGEGRLNYIVNIFHRANDTSSWVQVKSISKTRTDIRYELKEDNLVKISLVFPIGLNRRWNANALNIEEEQSYRYTKTHESLTLGALGFDSTITVSQRNEENLIERISTEEKYATQVGLIYRKDIDLRTLLNGEISSGYEATITLIESKP